jgi:hypothetical protein
VTRNTHWNDAGNELAASILFARLQGRVEAMLAGSQQELRE